MKISIICFFLLYSTLISNKVIKKNDFSVYVFTHRYDNRGNKFIQKNAMFKKIDLLGGNRIDPENDNNINYKSITAHLIKLYPRRLSTGVLCVNIENSLYHSLKEKKKSNNFNFAINEFIKMVNYIKKIRPLVKIGIYGIPFRTYYSDQIYYNNSLDVLLQKTDIIFPSLYLLFPDKQKGIFQNDRYLTENLQTAFYYADRLNKPVIPFVWYMISPNNKLYGGELLGKNEMKRYINTIRKFTSKNKNKVEGIVWWESSKKAFLKHVKQPSHLENEKVILNSTDILINYSTLIN